jgi:hypothetical protein
MRVQQPFQHRNFTQLPPETIIPPFSQQKYLLIERLGPTLVFLNLPDAIGESQLT